MDEVKLAALDVVVRARVAVMDVEQLVRDARVVEAYLRDDDFEALQAIRRFEVEERQRAQQAAAALRMTGGARP